MYFLIFVLTLFVSCARAGNFQDVMKGTASNVKFIPYMDASINQSAGRPNKYYSDAAVKLGIDVVFMGFLTASGSKKAAWSGSDVTPMDWAKPFTEELKAGNVKVGVAFGGALGADVSNVMSHQELVNTYQSVIDTLHADYLDFDFENGQFNTDVAFPAIKEIKTKNPGVQISLTLPVMPTGLRGDGVDMILSAKTAGVIFDRVHIMTMDYGSSFTQMGKLAIDAIKATKDQLATVYTTLSEAELYAKIVPVVMIGQNDVSAETFTFDDLHMVTAFAKQKGIDVSMWSLTRDSPGAKAGAASATNSGYPDQTYPFQFTDLFIKDMKGGSTTTTGQTTSAGKSTTAKPSSLTSQTFSILPLTFLYLTALFFFF